MSDASEEDGISFANRLVVKRKTRFSDIPVPDWPDAR